ncbi:MAG TPA: hypothetical protein VMS98_04090 [Thermoanaerobaculia bacterium]|nr:hypothetical protein [Thermoanaerobaculia bacterium]
MQKRRVVAISLVIAAACATGAQRPANIPRPELSVAATGQPFFGSGFEAPVGINVQITNLAGEPIIVRSVRVASPGMVQFGIRPTERVLNETLAAGETKVFNLSAMAFASEEGLDPTEPLSIRAQAYFEVGGKQFREMYNFLNVTY